MYNIIETRIPTYAFAELDDEIDEELQTVCKRFAREMNYNMAFDYYSIYWHEHNWTLANIVMPDLKRILTRMP
jgi:Skp family chaperone for outer membrane proteins